MFLGWDRSKLGGLLDHIQVLNPIPNTYLYRRGSTNKDIYIIVNGEIELMVPIILSQNQVLKNTEKIAKNLTKNTNSVNLKEYRQNVEVSLIKLGTGNYFGDEDGFNCEIK